MIKSLLPMAVFALLTAGAWQQTEAQSGTVVQTFYAIGLAHAKAHPYNFTGRVFGFTDGVVGFGSGTLIRRHTALTAAHVVFDPTAGFQTAVTFTRGLYGNYFLSQQEVSALDVLIGYQAAVETYGEATNPAEARDLAYVLVSDAPVDSTWGVFLADPTQLTNNDARFIIGYPGVTFDGRTMAYIVPTAPYVQIGPGDSGDFNNDSYAAEPGFSGGAVYAVVNNVQTVVAELTTGNSDTTGEFNIETVRAIDKEAGKFLQDAEYTNGLIKKVKITGPTVASRGVTLTYDLTVKFLVPNVDGSAATTDRYTELKLKSDTPGTSTAPLTTITKISNTQFQVTFSPTLRAGSTVTLTGYFDKNMPAPKSTLAVLLQ